MASPVASLQLLGKDKGVCTTIEKNILKLLGIEPVISLCGTDTYQTKFQTWIIKTTR